MIVKGKTHEYDYDALFFTSYTHKLVADRELAGWQFVAAYGVMLGLFVEVVFRRKMAARSPDTEEEKSKQE